MAEKKGNTVKLKYDFPTQLCCEIYQESLGDYYRVTCNEFRSFGGKRRILNIDDPKNVYYENYHGPVYWLGTNKKVSARDLEPKVMFLGDRDPRDFGKRRRNESFTND